MTLIQPERSDHDQGEQVVMPHPVHLAYTVTVGMHVLTTTPSSESQDKMRNPRLHGSYTMVSEYLIAHPPLHIMPSVTSGQTDHHLGLVSLLPFASIDVDIPRPTKTPWHIGHNDVGSHAEPYPQYTWLHTHDIPSSGRLAHQQAVTLTYGMQCHTQGLGFKQDGEPQCKCTWLCMLDWMPALGLILAESVFVSSWLMTMLGQGFPNMQEGSYEFLDYCTKQTFYTGCTLRHVEQSSL